MIIEADYSFEEEDYDEGEVVSLNYETTLLSLIKKTFGDNGFLKRVLKMESRPQQTRMADEVAKSFLENYPLFFGAGTGVGKSLAYLLPGLIYSLLSKRKFIVSTHTIPLQQQILKKDLKICRSLFSRIPELEVFKDFKVSLMLGKGNFLCGTRLKEALRRYGEGGLFNGGDGTSDTEILQKLAEWYSTDTCTGIREDIPFQVPDNVWENVSSESLACSSKLCSPTTCHYTKMREAISKSDIIIVNHSLLFSLLGSGLSPDEDARGVLYTNDFVVLDEAHQVPSTAANYFGVEVSSFGLIRLLSRVTSGLKKGGILQKYTKEKQKILELITDAKSAVDSFFNEIEFTFLEKELSYRFKKSDWAQNICELPLGNLEVFLKKLSEVENKEQIKLEIIDVVKRIEAYRLAIRECLEIKNYPKHAYWVALRKTNAHKIVTLYGAPVDVAKSLFDCLLNRNTSVVFSSATLSDDRLMKRFKARCGCDFLNEPPISKIENSPFNFKKNMEIYALDYLGKNILEKNMNTKMCDIIAHCVRKMPNGGTLVLTTSYKTCLELGEILENELDGERIVLVQGRTMRRQELLDRFVAGKNAVLVGTATFWTGIDIPGKPLSQVVITKFPFANQKDPMIQAQQEFLAQQGKNPFLEMSLPDAIFQFKQGIGRLIRTSTDRGRLIILDARVKEKLYGKQFLNALPHQNYKFFNGDNYSNVIDKDYK